MICPVHNVRKVLIGSEWMCYYCGGVEPLADTKREGANHD